MAPCYMTTKATTLYSTTYEPSSPSSGLNWLRSGGARGGGVRGRGGNAAPSQSGCCLGGSGDRMGSMLSSSYALGDDAAAHSPT